MYKRQDGENVENKVLAEEVQAELWRACESLKSPYRDIAVAYFCQEKSPEEIATEQNKNIKTVQTQIYRARARLQKIYGKEQMPWDSVSPVSYTHLDVYKRQSQNRAAPFAADISQRK